MTAVERPSQRMAQREATRRGILAAARTLFRERGVDGVSMDDVARAAAVGRATVYLHFSGKQAVLAALLAEDWDRQARLFDQLGRGGEIDKAAIAAWLGRVVEGMRRARDSFAIHRVALGQDAGMAALHRAHRHRLAEVLTRRMPTFAAEADDVTRRVEAAMIVAEIEHLAAAAATEWDSAEISAAIGIMTARIVRFAEVRRSPELDGQASSE